MHGNQAQINCQTGVPGDPSKPANTRSCSKRKACLPVCTCTSCGRESGKLRGGWSCSGRNCIKRDDCARPGIEHLECDDLTRRSTSVVAEGNFPSGCPGAIQMCRFCSAPLPLAPREVKDFAVQGPLLPSHEGGSWRKCRTWHPTPQMETGSSAFTGARVRALCSHISAASCTPSPR